MLTILFLFFRETYSRSMSSLECKAFASTLIFFVPWSINIIHSLLHFKNRSEYLTGGTAQAFILFIRFLLYNLIFRSFLVLLRYSFFFFFFLSSSFVWLSQLPTFPSIFSEHFYFSLDLTVPFLPSNVIFRFLLLAWRIFLCQIPSLCPDWYNFTVCFRDKIIFLFFANSLISSMYIRWLIISCDFCILLCISRVCDDFSSPWNISLWIFASAKFSPLAINSTLQVFMVFSIKIMTSSDILYNFMGSYDMPFWLTASLLKSPGLSWYSGWS